MDEDALLYIKAVEKRLEDLRAADLTAIRLAHADLSKRLEGFPQLFATKEEMEAARNAVIRLEKDAIPRELYEEKYSALSQEVKDSLREDVFNSFLENYRTELDRAAQERRSVAEVLAKATDTVRAQIAEERGEYITVDVYDQRHHELAGQINAVERWEYKLVGGLVFATFVAPIVSAVIVYYITHHA